MRERVKQVMADVFGCAAGEIPDDASPETFEGWDSLRQVELMLALEMVFDVRIPAEAMLELVTLEQIDDFLCERVQ
jgi:acyl carrier protein